MCFAAVLYGESLSFLTFRTIPCCCRRKKVGGKVLGFYY